MNPIKVQIALLASLFTLASQGLAQPANDSFANRIVLTGSTVLYIGTPVSSLNLVASNDNAGSNLTSSVSFNAVCNQTYQMRRFSSDQFPHALLSRQALAVNGFCKFR